MNEEALSNRDMDRWITTHSPQPPLRHAEHDTDLERCLLEAVRTWVVARRDRSASHYEAASVALERAFDVFQAHRRPMRELIHGPGL